MCRASVVSDPQIAVMLINIKRLIQGVQMVSEALQAGNRARTGAPPVPGGPPSRERTAMGAGATVGSGAGADAARIAGSPDLSAFATGTESAQLAELLGPRQVVLPMARAALTALVSWGMSDTLDELCSTRLGLARLPPNLAIGHRGYGGACPVAGSD